MKIKFDRNYSYHWIGIKCGQWQRVYHVRRPLRAIQCAYRETIAYVCDLTGQSIYGIWWSRDCDMCESYTPTRFNSRKALERAYENAALDAEGPYGFEECSREEFKNATSQTRDRAFEAYENGNGRSIYV